MSGASTTALFALATIFVAGAGAVSPRNAIGDAPSIAGGGVTKRLSRADTTTFAIMIDPWRATSYDLGAGNAINFPAGSVCDPAKSSYGAGEWDRACVASRRPITVTVKAWLDGAGHPTVDFTPEIRFVPSVLPAGWVTLTLADRPASANVRLGILSCRTVGGVCTDESRQDSTLTTLRDRAAGRVTRRIKHFSGYTVGAAPDVR